MKPIRIHWVWLVFTIPLIYWAHDPHNAPEWLKKHYVKKVLQENNHLINEILMIYERSKTEDSPIYCLDAMAEYSVWFEKNKYFIKEKPELKESVITKLKEAMSKVSSESDDFNVYLKGLE